MQAVTLSAGQLAVLKSLVVQAWSTEAGRNKGCRARGLGPSNVTRWPGKLPVPLPLMHTGLDSLLRRSGDDVVDLGTRLG